MPIQDVIQDVIEDVVQDVDALIAPVPYIGDPIFSLKGTYEVDGATRLKDITGRRDGVAIAGCLDISSNTLVGTIDQFAYTPIFTGVTADNAAVTISFVYGSGQYTLSPADGHLKNIKCWDSSIVAAPTNAQITDSPVGQEGVTHFWSCEEHGNDDTDTGDLLLDAFNNEMPLTITGTVSRDVDYTICFSLANELGYNDTEAIILTESGWQSITTQEAITEDGEEIYEMINGVPHSIYE